MRHDANRSYVALAAMAFAASLPVALLRPEFFAPYLGSAPAPLAIAAVAAIGWVCLSELDEKGWRATKPTAAAAPKVGLLAVLFGAAVILADLAARFPANINVPAPWALAFYPAIGFIAEIAFHVAPLAALVSLRRGVAADRDAWPLIAVVALIEPAFQVRAAIVTGALSALDVFVIAHVYAFSLAQLWLFRQHGFGAMISLRLCYYLIWHVAWGYARLRLT